jgi:predicted N-formylglutamate amidohydrolase
MVAMLPLVVSCEHAWWQLPEGCDLGVPLDLLRSQASWDHGALEVAQRIAASAYDARLFAGKYSRMFVDLNRAAAHPHVIPCHSYGVDVPGNLQLDVLARASRLAAFHQPYWASVANAVDETIAAHGQCIHISSHSFCPALDPLQRNFDIGILFDPAHDFEASIANKLLRLVNEQGLRARANQPYSGTSAALVTELRSTRLQQRYAGIEIESSHAITMAPGGIDKIVNALNCAIAGLT